jgi:hypothetical protein
MCALYSTWRVCFCEASCITTVVAGLCHSLPVDEYHLTVCYCQWQSKGMQQDVH